LAAKENIVNIEQGINQIIKGDIGKTQRLTIELIAGGMKWYQNKKLAKNS